MFETRWSLLLLTGSLITPLASCSPEQALNYGRAESAVTVTFQDGVSGYAGTDDGPITNSGGGNGGNDFGGTNSLMMVNTSTGTESEALIRFNGISLPSGATVTSASVTLTFEDYAGGHNLRAYYVKNAWDTTAKWVPRTASANWASPGAKGAGTDRSTATAFPDDSSWTASGVVTRTYPLDVATVQGWVDTPSTNQGIIMTNTVVNKVLRVYTEDHPTVAYHPKLSITYSTGGGGTDAGTGSCPTVTTGQWLDNAFTEYDSFVAEFDATPSVSNADVVMAFTKDSPAQDFTKLQAIARFYTNGLIEVRDGATYTADVPMSYSGGTTYHFKFTVDNSTRTYSVSVKPNGGTETLLASNYSFRSDAPNPITGLNNFAMTSTTGTLEVCNLTVTETGGGGDPPPSGDHPRLLITSDFVQNVLGPRAQSTNSAVKAFWNTLRAKCEAFTATGTSVWSMPSSATDQNCSSGDICLGYYGAKLMQAIPDLALCYQVGTEIGDGRANVWAARAVEALTQLSQYTNYTSNSSYGIRNFVPAMAIGYDWLYNYSGLSDTVKANLRTRMYEWVDTIDTNSDAWGRNHPVGNYSAAYYAAKAMAALATDGESSYASTFWTDWYGTRHYGGTGSWQGHAGVAQFFTNYINGGGHPGGWQYGGLALRLMYEAALMARTAKGVNVINDPAKPAYEHPLNNAQHLIYFTWPSLKYMDDRDTIKASGSFPTNGCPTGNAYGNAIPPTHLAVMSSSLFSQSGWDRSWSDEFRDYTKRIRALFPTGVGGFNYEWADFLYWDELAPRTDFATLPRDYLSGTNYLSTRSSWSTDATFASFRTMPYADGHPYTSPDVGSLAITRGDTPFVVNAGFVSRCYGNLRNYDYYYSIYEADHDGVNGNPGAHQLYNVFYVSSTAGQNGKEIDATTSPPMSSISLYDTASSYVLARGTQLDDVYNTVASWSRDVLFFRKSGETGVFVVYDRTNASCTGQSPRLAWHFPPAPVRQGSSNQWNVTDSFGFKGSMTAVLPTNASTSLVDIPNARPLGDCDSDPDPNNPCIPAGTAQHKLYRVNVTPSSCTSDIRWLTVLDPATGTTTLHSTQAIDQSLIKGVVLRSPGDTSNKVAIFSASAAGTPITSSFSFSMQQPATGTSAKVIIADLTPGAKFNISVSGTTTQTVTVTPNTTGTWTANPKGVLHVDIASGGGVSAGS